MEEEYESETSDDVYFPKGAIIAAVIVPVVLILGIWLVVDFILYRRRKVSAWDEKFRDTNLHDSSAGGSAQDDNYREVKLENPAGEDNVAFSNPTTHEATIHPPRYSKSKQKYYLENSSNLRIEPDSKQSNSRVTTTGAKEGEITSELTDKMRDDPSQDVTPTASVNGQSDVRINGNNGTDTFSYPVELEMLEVTSSLSRQNSLQQVKKSTLESSSRVSQA